MFQHVTEQPDRPATADQLVKEYLDIRAIAEGASARALEIDNASPMPFAKVQFEANAVADLAWEMADLARERMLEHVPVSLAETEIVARLLLTEAEDEVIPEHDVILFLRTLAQLA
jgi:hypothetical protein